jgi:hypothetical protein
MGNPTFYPLPDHCTLSGTGALAAASGSVTYSCPSCGGGFPSSTFKVTITPFQVDP